MKATSFLLAATALLGFSASAAAQAECSYSDDFEPTQDGGWKFEVAQDDTDSGMTWALTNDVHAESPTHSMFSDAKAPVGAKDDRMVAPPQNLTADSHLIFYHWFLIEAGYDGGVLEVSTDGGATWVDVVEGGGVFVENGYNDNIDGGGGDSIIMGRDAWSGFSSSPDVMDRVEVDLGAFAGEDVLVRWRLVTDSLTLDTVDGWYIDNVEFTGLDCPPPPPPPGEITPCELPGIPVATDPEGDFTSPPGSSNQDVTGIWVAELGAHTNALTFTMKVADLSTLPSNGIWRIYFNAPDGVTYFASMVTDGAGAATFHHGFISETGSNSTAGAAVSGSYTESGFIHITVATSTVGSVVPDDKLTGFFGRTALLVGAANSGATATVDNGDPGTIEYVVKGNDFCPKPPLGSICVAPGVEFQSDAAGDAPSDQHDVLSLLLAQPPENGTDLVLTMKVADLSTIPPQSQWHIEFIGPDGARRSAYMDTFAAAPEFFIGEIEVDGTATFYGGNPVAIDGSASAAGTIEMVVPRGRVGNPADGDSFNSVGSVVFQQAGLLLARLDSTETTATFSVQDNAFCTNAPPLATLLADATSGEAPLGINFSVSGSDAEGELQSFSLNFGDGQSLDNQPFTAETVIVPHTFQEAGSYTVSLSVADETGLQSTNLAEVIIVVTGPPVARAGDDFSILEGEVGMIDGSNSNNGGAGDLNYSWSQQSGVIATLSGSDSSTASFTAPDVCEPQDLIFQLSVSNAAGMDTDEVVVTVENINQPPLANAGSNKVVDQTARVRLDGSGTSDPDTCQELSYQWVQYQGPLVELANADQANATFEAPTVGGDTVLGFRLIVTDSEGATSNSAVLVTVTARIIGETKVGGLPPFGLILLTLFGTLARRRR